MVVSSHVKLKTHMGPQQPVQPCVLQVSFSAAYTQLCKDITSEKLSLMMSPFPSLQEV